MQVDSTALRAPSRRWVPPAVVGAVAAVGTAAIAAADPGDTGTPLCLSQSMFGVDCPLCGGLRCVNSLVRGDVLAAADHNVLLAVALPLAALAWVVWLVATWRGRTLRLPRVPTGAWVLLAAVVVAFTVSRNLDGGGWVAWLGSDASG